MAAKPNKEVSNGMERTKPTFLRRVRIRGYKSIAFCDVTLEPLTILVGRNASGKSNFLDALAFLRDLMDLRATEAVNERTGWRAIHCRTSGSAEIEMGFESTFESREATWDASYLFSLEVADLNQIRVGREELILTEHGKGRRCGYQVADTKVNWIGREHFETNAEWARNMDARQGTENDQLEDPRFFRRRRSDRLLLSVLGTQPFLDLAEGLRASCVYNFSPPAIRSHQPITASPILMANASNLARAIEGLREIEPETVTRIGNYLKAIVPGLLEFQTVEYGDFETLRFRLEGESGQPPLEFDASSMSDGTLRILAALVAAFQIVLPCGFPGFIGIEEPEAALHPAGMRALVAALDEATLRTQILLTTHSPDLLDAAQVKPENVRIVEYTGGSTSITPVDETSLGIVEDRLGTLGSLERDRQLELNPHDLDRQADLGCVRRFGRVYAGIGAV
jgi:predicted ATPase